MLADRVVKINMRCYGPKPRSFLQLTRGMGMLPVVEIDGKVWTESAVIMEQLETTFPEHRPLLPPRGSATRELADTQMAQERELFGCWLRWLRAEESDRARDSFEASMDRTDAMLGAAGVFFGGAEISLVDRIFARFTK